MQVGCEGEDGGWPVCDAGVGVVGCETYAPAVDADDARVELGGGGVPFAGFEARAG